MSYFDDNEDRLTGLGRVEELAEFSLPTTIEIDLTGVSPEALAVLSGADDGSRSGHLLPDGDWWPCDGMHCCRGNQVQTTHGGHVFGREERDDAAGYTGWRWTCGCGSKGRWQWQSPSCCYHAWLRHAGLHHDGPPHGVTTSGKGEKR